MSANYMSQKYCPWYRKPSAMRRGWCHQTWFNPSHFVLYSDVGTTYVAYLLESPLGAGLHSSEAVPISLCAAFREQIGRDDLPGNLLSRRKLNYYVALHRKPSRAAKKAQTNCSQEYLLSLIKLYVQKPSKTTMNPTGRRRDVDFPDRRRVPTGKLISHRWKLIFIDRTCLVTQSCLLRHATTSRSAHIESPNKSCRQPAGPLQTRLSPPCCRATL